MCECPLNYLTVYTSEDLKCPILIRKVFDVYYFNACIFMFIKQILKR